MNLSKARACPVCGGRPTGSTYPYATRFNDVHFDYLKCGNCKSVFVDPCPDAQTFSRMYAKSEYHDRYYDGSERDDYTKSARLLSRYLKPGSVVLDYGCGMGGFLKASLSHSLVPVGVEFDPDAALFAAKAAGCQVMSVEHFGELAPFARFDAIHLGDVLEHLPDPAATLAHLLRFLKPGGALFVEGPLQANPSAVFWSARIFGALKLYLRPAFVPNDPPQHLIYTNVDSQKDFFLRVDERLRIAYWQVTDNGWPYASGGVIKRSIATIAITMGGHQFAGLTFGNYFKSIWITQESQN